MNIVISFRLLVSVRSIQFKSAHIILSAILLCFFVLLCVLHWMLGASSIILSYLDIYCKVLQNECGIVFTARWNEPHFLFVLLQLSEIVDVQRRWYRTLENRILFAIYLSFACSQNSSLSLRFSFFFGYTGFLFRGFRRMFVYVCEELQTFMGHCIYFSSVEENNFSVTSTVLTLWALACDVKQRATTKTTNSTTAIASVTTNIYVLKTFHSRHCFQPKSWSMIVAIKQDAICAFAFCAQGTYNENCHLNIYT